MIKIAFWALVVLDVLGIGLFFLLGLAAAGSTKSNPILVALLLLVLPALPLVAAVFMFTRTTSPGIKFFALLSAAAPLLIAVAGRTFAEATMRLTTNEEGEMTWYRAGPEREIAEAIMRNDSATVARVAPTAKVNKKGAAGMTLLVLSLRQMEESPEAQVAIVRSLLAAKADPNLDGQYDYPLALAVGESGKAGLEPMKMLLDAGANPNQRTSFSHPVWFSGTFVAASPEALPMLLDRGADINAETKDGETALISVAMTRRWDVALLLLQRGADWKRGKNVSGLGFAHIVDGDAGHDDPDGLRAKVKQFINQH